MRYRNHRRHFISYPTRILWMGCAILTLFVATTRGGDFVTGFKAGIADDRDPIIERTWSKITDEAKAIHWHDADRPSDEQG